MYHNTLNRIGFTDAENNLSELLDRVEQGEEFTITRHDEAVARLVPAKRTSLHEASKAIEAMRTLRASNPVVVTTEEIRSWKDNGRP